MNPPDEVWMRRALDLAERGRGSVEPNPLVGAVIVRDAVNVGEGWHQKYGEAHAEINAIANAGEAARGATLYVTLEPCCHHGKTPPCTDAVIQAGIARVVAALQDPFPQVAGKGTAALSAAGIPIESGVCESEARLQNAPYLKLLSTGRPYVHAKWAMSLDGKIATRTGDSRWISNKTSRQRVHALRGRVDAIVIGIGTALADDPLLTARPAGPRVACRVILDSKGRLPLTSQLVQTAGQIPTLLVTNSMDRTIQQPLRDAGCEILPVRRDPQGRPGIKALLDELGQRRWTNILVEGGSAVLGAFFDLDEVDEAHVFVAPKLIGGAQSKTPVAGKGWASIATSPEWVTHSIENVDGDAYLNCLRRQLAV